MLRSKVRCEGDMRVAQAFREIRGDPKLKSYLRSSARMTQHMGHFDHSLSKDLSGMSSVHLSLFGMLWQPSSRIFSFHLCLRSFPKQEAWKLKYFACARCHAAPRTIGSVDQLGLNAISFELSSRSGREIWAMTSRLAYVRRRKPVKTHVQGAPRCFERDTRIVD
eukprot:228415-Amphidinium_carterae.1